MTDHAPFTFIIGSPRSGTTLLRAMLDSHPVVSVPPESYFLVSVLAKQAKYGSGAQFDRAAVVRDIAAAPGWHTWQMDDVVLDEIALDDSLATASATVRAVYDRYAEFHGKHWAIDKTPRHTEHVELIDRSFPGCRFVHLVRDGRDVVPSLREMPFFPAGFADAARFWRGRAMHGRGARAIVGPSRFHELKYEDLVVDPERSLASLCAFLEIDYSPLMLEYPNRVESVIAGTGNRTFHQNIAAAPKRTRDWRTTMTPRDAARFEALAGDALAMFGYERGPAPSMLLRGEASVRHAADSLGQRARILRVRVERRLRRP